MIVIHNDELNILFFMKYRAEGAEVPGNFLAALPPHFFSKLLRLLIYSLVFFFASSSGSKGTKTPRSGSGSWLMVKFGEIFFPPQTTNG